MSDSQPRSRTRSASPAREPRDRQRKRQKTGGFKWKEKPSKRELQDDADERLDRGYRERSSLKFSRDRDTEDGFGRDKLETDRRDKPDAIANRDSENRNPTQREGGSGRTSKNTVDVKEKFGRAATSDKFGKNALGVLEDGSKTKSDRPEKKVKKNAKSAAPSEPMIVVNVNDRLGTKAEIPCFASDSIKAFKAMVAMKIGRAPHEILLKRQGERPFKDQLTLEDYGVSNGVQLDLELDTGD